MRHPCPYCVGPLGPDSDREHVFPNRWFPVGAPPVRLIVESCHACNQDYGRLEESLLRIWGLCLSPSHPSSTGLGARALRGLDFQAARTPGDARARASNQRRTHARVQILPLGEGRILGGEELGPLERRTSETGEEIEGFPGFVIPEPNVSRFTTKLVRGLHFLQHREPLPLTYTVQTFCFEDAALPKIFGLCKQAGMSRGPSAPPAFMSMLKHGSRDHREAWWFFALWEQVFLQARVHPPSTDAAG